MSMLTHQPTETNNEDRFRALCAELEDYEHLPEMIPGSASSRLITDQSHEDTIHESILAWLTQP
ncbi:MAG TPA: hypothetical protein VG293_02625 [Solirubrobacteraceae bacterium]|nr:hypothetical protein [Solirubrobacteraceae bacterium]